MQKNGSEEMGLSGSRQIAFGPNPSFPSVWEVVSRCLDADHIKRKYGDGKRTALGEASSRKRAA